MHSHGFRYLKKILCVILMIQLACPPSVLMAMQRDEESTSSSSVLSPLRGKTPQEIPFNEQEGETKPEYISQHSETTIRQQNRFHVEGDSNSLSSRYLYLDDLQVDNDSEKIFSKQYILAFREDFSDNDYKFTCFKSIISILIGIIVCIPQISISLAVGKHYNSDLFGGFLVGTLFLSDGSIIAWLTSELIDDAQKLYEKSSRIRKTSGVCSVAFLNEIKLGIISLILGVLSTTPDVYKSYKYNSVKWLAGISLLYGLVAKPLGFYKFFSNFTIKSECCKTTPEDLDRQQALSLIDKSKRYFLLECKKNGPLQTQETLEIIETPAELYDRIVPAHHRIEREDFLLTTKTYRPIFILLSAIFPLAESMFEGVMAYKGYSQLIKYNYINYVLTAFSVLPSIFITIYVVGKATNSFFDKLDNLKRKLPASDYFRAVHPIIYVGLGVTSILLAISNSFGGYYIITDNLRDTFLRSISGIIAALAIPSGLTFGTYTIFNTMKNNASTVLRKSNNADSYTLSTIKKLSKLSIQISSSTPAKLTKFITSFFSDTSPSTALNIEEF